MVSQPSGNGGRSTRPYLWLGLALAGLLFVLAAMAGCRPGADRPDSREDGAGQADSISPPSDSFLSDSGALEADSAALEPWPEPEPGDTLISAEDSTLRRRRTAGALGGLAAGLNKWPAERWCSGPMSGTVTAATPKLAAGQIRRAAFCGFRIVLAIPRNQITTTANNYGAFSPTRGTAACDAYGRALPADTLRKYAGRTLLAIWIGDEFHTELWGGRPTRNTDIAAYAKHCKARLPGVPIALRIWPAHRWVQELSAAQWSGVDLWWAQWSKARGNRRLTDVAKQKDWYAQQVAAAERKGARVVLGLNVRDCDKANTRTYCTPDEVRRFGTVAVNHPKNCLFSAWWYEDRMWNDARQRAAWTEVLVEARGRPPTSCA